MAKILSGDNVAIHIKDNIKRECAELQLQNINPTMAIVRVGNNPGDISYEKAAVKVGAQIGVTVENVVLDNDISEADFFSKLEELNKNSNIHGIMIFRPLPSSINEKKVAEAIAADKDVDCMNPYNLYKVFEGDMNGILPCTPAAVMEILKYYDIETAGKQIAVVGRSLVVGKPLSMMLLKENATITICHSKTQNLPEVMSRADIVVAAIGRAKFIKENYVREEAIVIDVGINMDENNKMCGDVDYESVYPKAGAITPVPRGVGTVTTSILFMNLMKAIKLQNNK